jgi:hypothetical protein
MGSMAIKEKEVLVTVSSNVTYYENLGYVIPKRKGKNGKLSVPKGTKFLIKIEDLPKSSNSARLTKICDDCGKKISNQSYSEIIYSRNNGDGKDRCIECGKKQAGNSRKTKFANERIGSINKNNHGTLMKIVEYNSEKDMVVEFETGNYVHARWAEFRKGKVQNPYDKSVYGVGYLGEGEYKTSITNDDGKHKQTIQYKIWFDMLKRCYSEKYHDKYPTYKDCTVCDEWLNFQKFSEWYDQNYYEIDEEKMELDKDILMKGNKIYSPETCVFVPKKVNYLFIKCDARRGNLPIGVYQHSETKKYVANCSNGKKTINLGCYITPKEAFIVYKFYKEKVIKQMAEEYKGKIPNNLYEAMLRYEVEITD